MPVLHAFDAHPLSALLVIILKSSARMASGGVSRPPASFISSSSSSSVAVDATASSRLKLLPCAGYEQRHNNKRINSTMFLSDLVRSSDPLGLVEKCGLGAGCTDPLLLNYDSFVCPNPVCKQQKGKTLGILSCGCIMCDICIEKLFNLFNKQENGKCPMCDFKVFKEQSRTKIGGTMLRNKVTTTRYTALHRLTTSPLPQRPKALDEWNDPHVRGEQLTRKDIYEQVRFCA